jgi:hypothetical protein
VKFSLSVTDMSVNNEKSVRQLKQCRSNVLCAIMFLVNLQININQKFVLH